MTERPNRPGTATPSHQEAQDAWVAAEAAVTEVMRRCGSAIRDRPPVTERARFDQYQEDVMAPLIAERDAARAAAKAAKQAMFEACTRDGA